MFTKERKRPSIKYQDDYFFILNAWWIREQEGSYEFCRMINEEEVPESIRLNWY